MTDWRIGESRILDAAYGYVDRSSPWPIFPANARSRRPLIRTGRDHAEHATTDPEVLLDWYGRGLLRAIGMPTGAASGTVVIDVDCKRDRDGMKLLAELEAALCPLPRERVARTQSGGLHIYCAHPGAAIRVRTGAGADSPIGRLLSRADGLDVRADGGIVMLPPSCGYSWLAADDGTLPSLPVLWLAAIQGMGDPLPGKTHEPYRCIDHERRWSDPTRGGVISDGGRNAALYRRGVALRCAGATQAEILSDLACTNAARCVPPLDEREVVRIAASASRASGGAK